MTNPIGPIRNPSLAEQQGFGRMQKIPIDERVWHGLRRQLLRMVQGYRYVEKEIARVLEDCRHAEGCLAPSDHRVPCLPGCPDRETWLSSLVILGQAQQYALLQRDLPLRMQSEYRPPGRETYDAVVTELEVLREAGDMLAELARLEAAAADTIPPPAGETPFAQGPIEEENRT